MVASEFKIISASTTHEAERDLNEAAKAGYRFLSMSSHSYSSPNNPLALGHEYQVVVLMIKEPSSEPSSSAG